MRITVFGATGGTGRQVVRQALTAGHHVTAVVRDPERLSMDHPRLDVVTADVTDPEALVPVLRGRDAAVSGLGPPCGGRAGIATSGTRAILTALHGSGVRRFEAISAGPLAPLPDGDPLRPLLMRILKDVYADLARMEEAMRTSTVDWTIVRVPRLTDKPATGRYRRLVGGDVPRALTISRGDLAHAMLSMLDDPATIRQAVGVAY